MRDMRMVTVYSMPSCPLCLMVKSYLKDLGIAFEEKDALKSSAILLMKGFSHAPILEIDGVFYSVFNMESLTQILKDHNVK